MAVTASAIIGDALRKIGAVPGGQPPRAHHIADGLRGLNGLIDAWRNNDLLCYADVRYVHELTGGVSAYAVGPGIPCRCTSAITRSADGRTVTVTTTTAVPVEVGERVIFSGLMLSGGDAEPTPNRPERFVRFEVASVDAAARQFTATGPTGVTVTGVDDSGLSFVRVIPGYLYQPRPQWIRAASIRTFAGIEDILNVVYNADEWQVRQGTSLIDASTPGTMWVQGGADRGDAVQIRLWPTPQGGNLILYTALSLQRFDTATQEYDLPPAYERALVFNLAQDLCPDYGKPVPRSVELTAAEALRDLYATNQRTPVLESDLVGLEFDTDIGRYGIF